MKEDRFEGAKQFNLEHELDALGAKTLKENLEKLTPAEQGEWVALTRVRGTSSPLGAAPGTYEEIKTLSSEDKQAGYEAEQKNNERLVELNKKAGILTPLEQLEKKE